MRVSMAGRPVKRLSDERPLRIAGAGATEGDEGLDDFGDIAFLRAGELVRDSGDGLRALGVAFFASSTKEPRL